MGATPTFKASFYTQRVEFGATTAKSIALVLNVCMSSGLSLPTRNDDFEIPKFSFSAFANQAGIVGTMSISE